MNDPTVILVDAGKVQFVINLGIIFVAFTVGYLIGALMESRSQVKKDGEPFGVRGEDPPFDRSLLKPPQGGTAIVKLKTNREANP